MPISLLGIPYDASSSFQRGTAQGPEAIRAALRSDSTNGWNEELLDVRATLADADDLVLPDSHEALGLIEAGAERLLATGATPIFLGGDHAITWPLVRAVARRHPRLTILHLDAHPDLYDALDGDRLSHACPMARILEEKLARHLVQCGIRTLNQHQLEQAHRFGVEMVQMRDGVEAMITAARRLEGAAYLSVDLDALDPAFAPGINHPEPGGLTTRELLRIIQAIPKGRLIGADIVELSPGNDLRDLTARVAAKVVGEIVGRLGG
ncbi:MAG: agmatinase [Gemmatimonadota bacterium]|nr:agmatinase [Gemmatimonadota bacterium]